jgi:hypothetical protein
MGRDEDGSEEIGWDRREEYRRTEEEGKESIV